MPNTISVIRENPKNLGAWREWYEFAYPRVYYLIFKRTGGDSSLSEDATQHAFERFIKYKGYTKTDSDEKSVGYLVTTAKRYLADIQRKKIYTTPLGDKDAEIQGHDSVPIMSFELDYIREDLSKAEKEVFDLLVMGYSTGEISKILGLKYSATSVRIHRLRNQLRKILD